MTLLTCFARVARRMVHVTPPHKKKTLKNYLKTCALFHFPKIIEFIIHHIRNKQFCLLTGSIGCSATSRTKTVVLWTEQWLQCNGFIVLNPGVLVQNSVIVMSTHLSSSFQRLRMWISQSGFRTEYICFIN